MTGSTPRPTVLLADDDPFIVALYRGKLTQVGLAVEVTRDGEEALRRLHESLPSLLVLDLNMPRVNGVEVLRYIREASARPDLPVIVLSNACSQEMMASVQALHPTVFLMKRETTPNRVIEEILARLEANAAPAAPPAAGASTAGIDPGNRRLALATLGRAADETDRREALLDLYRQMQDDLQQLRRAPPLSIARQTGENAEALFEDLYARPSSFHPSTLHVLADLVDHMPAWRAAAESGEVMADPAPVLIVTEDDALRAALREMVDRPGFLPLVMRREATAMDLMRENPIGLMLWDAAKVSAAKSAWRRLRESSANRSVGILFLLPAERWSREAEWDDGRTAVSAKPPLPSEIRLRLYAFRSGGTSAAPDAEPPA